ncbi:MAG: HD domain-containing protein [Nitrospirae bacterium]|jgi:HD-GYP domain-containing protein (c-di-GMP phosphodiesterase class II)|nr:HD domain-containing protein [Nitrospirota bacterium]
MIETLNEFLLSFSSAVSNCSLYSGEHASVSEFITKTIDVLNILFNNSDSVEIMVIEDDIVVNKTLIRNAGIHVINLMKKLKRKGISRVDILKGVEFNEIKDFIVSLLDKEKTVKGYPHIVTGIVDIRLGGQKLAEDFKIGDISKLSGLQADGVREIFTGVSHFKKLETYGLEEIVLKFAAAFKRESNVLKLLCPVKSTSEYTYVHATNVAVLSMFQAESLGVREDLKHDIGIAALLHDVGKVFINVNILEKKEKLNDREWNEIKLHTVYGSKYLAKINGLTRLAPIVAYEHHLRFDGKGYPEIKNNSRKQHICSQIVAISDYFDALRSRRPYRKEQEFEEILFLMKNESEGMFNPFLLDNFIKSMFRVLSG